MSFMVPNEGFAMVLVPAVPEIEKKKVPIRAKGGATQVYPYENPVRINQQPPPVIKGRIIN